MKEIKNKLFHVLATRKKNSINERVNGLNYLFRVYFPKDFAINSVNGEEHAHTLGKWEGDHRRCFSCYKNFLWKKYREKMKTDFICTEKGGVCF